MTTDKKTMATMESIQERMARKFGLEQEDRIPMKRPVDQEGAPIRPHSPSSRFSQNYMNFATPSQDGLGQRNKLWELTKDTEKIALVACLAPTLSGTLSDLGEGKYNSHHSRSRNYQYNSSLPVQVQSLKESLKKGTPDNKQKVLRNIKVSWDKFPTSFPEASMKESNSTKQFLQGLDYMTPNKKTDLLDLMRQDLER